MVVEQRQALARSALSRAVAPGRLPPQAVTESTWPLIAVAVAVRVHSLLHPDCSPLLEEQIVGRRQTAGGGTEKTRGGQARGDTLCSQLAEQGWQVGAHVGGQTGGQVAVTRANGSGATPLETRQQPKVALQVCAVAIT